MKNKNIYVIYATKEIFAKRKGRKKDNADSINPPPPTSSQSDGNKLCELFVAECTD